MRRKPGCRRGEQSFGPLVEIGGGIQRQVCPSCGLIEIDLRASAEMEESRLFAPLPIDSIFMIRAAPRNELQQRFGVG